MTRQVQRIVVGTSLETASDPVVRAALTVRDHTGAEIHLVHGFPLPVVYGAGLHGGAVVDSQLEADRLRYRRLLEEQLDRIGVSAEIFAGLRLELDSGYRLLDQVAREVGADLIVVGASEMRGPLAPLLGSTVDRLLRRALQPVLVVRGEFEPPQKVLAPTDLSSLSERALADGLQILDRIVEGEDRSFDTDVLFVLSRIDREGSAHFRPEQVDRFARQELDTFVESFERPGLHPVLRSGIPRQEILAHLEAHPADLVLLGTHGRSGFERFLLGSVTSEVLRRVTTHALVAPSAEAAVVGEGDSAEDVEDEAGQEAVLAHWSEMA
ncbi:MAG: universal stress protein [Thermoanaerobaculia bacterium]|nr:universal stress protein [Thermoanaerobaculia bacterium]